MHRDAINSDILVLDTNRQVRVEHDDEKILTKLLTLSRPILVFLLSFNSYLTSETLSFDIILLTNLTR